MSAAINCSVSKLSRVPVSYSYVYSIDARTRIPNRAGNSCVTRHSAIVKGHRSSRRSTIPYCNRKIFTAAADPASPSLDLPDKNPDSALCPPTFLTTTGRVVAIGDFHGDWHKAVESFLAASLVTVQNGQLIWTGEDTIVVQMGDVLDRGDNEISIVRLLRALDVQARDHGGAVYMLNGNHESLNVAGDFRYVTPGAFLESAIFSGAIKEDELVPGQLTLQHLARIRMGVYKPGGPMALEFSKNPTVLVVNDTVFAHGGLLPIHVKYGLEKLNSEMAAWMRADKIPEGGKAAPPFLAMGDGSSVVWNRTLSKENFLTAYDRLHACSTLKQTLTRLDAKRLVVGHTPQLSGANCECNGCVWRIDVGMSSGVLNSPVQVLEIVRDEQGESRVQILPIQEKAILNGNGSTI